MAHIESGGGRGRKVSLELNLVPFIDLMSVLITFLLITAVWSQVSMIQIGSSLYGKKNEEQPAPQIPPDADVVLKLDIREKGYVLTLGKQVINVPLINAEYDEAGLVAQIEKAKQLRIQRAENDVTESSMSLLNLVASNRDKLKE